MAKPPRSANAPEFEDPVRAEAEKEEEHPGFDDPERVQEGESDDQSLSVGEGELSIPLSANDSGLSQVKAAIEGLLLRQAEKGVEGVATTSSSLGGAGNIQGVGYTLGDLSGNVEPGLPSLVVFTAEPASEDEVKGEIANAAGATDEDLDVTRVLVVKTGLIDMYAHRFKARPAPCGVSVGHHQITAGTLGVLARGRSGVRRNRLFVLSNNHVLANSNAGPVGAPILQPGSYDGGVNPRDRIGVLERFVPINFSAGASNYVDCATAHVVSSLVRREFVYLVNGQQRFFRVSSQTVNPQMQLLVGKSGRTTQLTQGRITAVGITVNVNFGAGRVATFRDQFSIVSTTSAGDFSQGGDSGSLIWTWNPARNPVGLLFAGGGGVTFANRIDRVLRALDISLHT
ncbi:MAG: S1 family peptidase [Planctomycetota bacterium]|nr:hypothetical protein [Planctomycetaceae bacterium]MDQ3332872.1 S1 family peptidase [Planctomycetota bacterium]